MHTHPVTAAWSTRFSVTNTLSKPRGSPKNKVAPRALTNGPEIMPDKAHFCHTHTRARNNPTKAAK